MRKIAIIYLALCAGPAVADANCADLWFTRNLVFDRAGHCFSSALGEAIFDNTDCTANEAKLDKTGQTIVDTILGLEAEFACKVDTTRTALQVDQIAARMRLIDLPVADEYASPCYGWRGAPVPLYSARNPTAPVTGTIEPGEDILMSFMGVDGWTFLYSSPDDPDMGWVRDFDWAGDSCTSNAG